MQQLLLASTSTVYGKPYLGYLLPELAAFFKGVEEVVFIPYARPSGLSYDAYTEVAKKAFNNIHIAIKGIHEFDSPQEAIMQAKGIFTGGGNSFVLLNELYQLDLLGVLKQRISQGIPYFGTSAGSNIAGPTIMTTNDMPIVYPPAFQSLGLIPFNINPHYIDPDPDSTHMGETRETRIKEYLVFNEIPVIGLREGSWLSVKGTQITLKGKLHARWFQTAEKPLELVSGHLFNK